MAVLAAGLEPGLVGAAADRAGVGAMVDEAPGAPAVQAAMRPIMPTRPAEIGETLVGWLVPPAPGRSTGPGKARSRAPELAIAASHGTHLGAGTDCGCDRAD